MQSNIMTFRGLVYSKYQKEADLARFLGWPPQRLNKISNGKKEPNIRELNDLAIALDVDVTRLLKIFLPEKSPIGQ